MGRRTCPRCGKAGDRSHEVKVEVRVAGVKSDIPGTGIKVCATCARELRIEIANVLDGARKGWIAEIGMPDLREMDDERQDRDRIGEVGIDGLIYQGDGTWGREPAEPPRI